MSVKNISLFPCAETLISQYTSLMHSLGRIPKKSDFSPSFFVDIMGWMFIGQRSGNNHIAVEFLGSKLERALGTDLTGQNMFSIYAEKEHQNYNDFFEGLLSTPCAGYNVRTVHAETGYTHNHQTIYFPVADEEGTVNRVIGVVNLCAFLSEEAVTAQFIHETTAQETPTHPDTKLLGHMDIGFGMPERKTIENITNAFPNIIPLKTVA